MRALSHTRIHQLVTLISCAVLCAAVFAQQPTFRTGTRLIVETVTVTDKDGTPIEGLTADDFVVTEDNEPQTISFVNYQRLDANGAAASNTAARVAGGQRAPSVVASNDARIAIGASQDRSYQDRRLLVLYFDLTALPPSDLLRAYSAARTYITTQMSPADLVSLMAFEGGAVKVKLDFTDDRARLTDALSKLVFGEDLDGDGIPDAATDVGTAFGQDDAEFNVLNTDRQLSALQTAATMLRGLSSRKSLVYFASGLRLNGADNQAQLRATTNAALRANVALYPVDARGLVASAPLGDATRQSPGGIGAFTGSLASVAVANMNRSQDTLFSLAKDTGGQPLFDSNDLALGIRQAANTPSYYTIGYDSTHNALDGKFHRVTITLRDRSAGSLSYREGYFADKEFARFTTADKERQLEEALMLDNPVTDITIALEVNYFQLNRAEYFVPVSVKIPGSELALARKGGAKRTLVDIIGEVKDDYGVTIKNVRDKLDIALNDQTSAQLATRPIQYETGFTLLPGQYVIKILARDAETGRIGTYLGSFAVPNLNREAEHLPISSVVLGSQRVNPAEAIYTVQKNAALGANPLVYDGQKLVPSVTRVFSRQRNLYVYLQAYQRDASATRPLVTFVTLFRGDVRVFESTPLGVTDGLDPKSKAVPLKLTVPLSDVEPGRYDCQVSVLDPDGQLTAFWRAPIAVIP